MFYLFDNDFTGEDLSALIDYLAAQSSTYGVVFQRYHTNASSMRFRQWIRTMGGELTLTRSWPGTKTEVDVCVAHIPVNPHTIAHLKEEISSLFSDEDSFEDLHFCRADGSILFFVTSHEGYGLVDINDLAVLNMAPFAGRCLSLYEGTIW